MAEVAEMSPQFIILEIKLILVMVFVFFIIRVFHLVHTWSLLPGPFQFLLRVYMCIYVHAWYKSVAKLPLFFDIYVEKLT